MTEQNDRFAVREMLVRQIRSEADGVISISLENVDGSDVPEWQPGSHVDLVLPSGLVRQYSLCGRPEDRKELRVAVLRDLHGRGGSKELHDTALVGRTIGVRGPRNHFKLKDADEYLLVAGGIGVTPILTMVRHLEAQGQQWRLLYGGRSRTTMAFLEELEKYGSAVSVVAEDESGLPDLRGYFSEGGMGAQIYCCGPEGLLRAVEGLGAELRIPVHIERFAASPKKSAAPSPPTRSMPAPPSDGEIVKDAGTGRNPDDAFFVELRKTGVTVEVDPDRTILETVREHLPQVISSCEEGFCGACETAVIEGIPDHRDDVLDPSEKAANKTMMICIGRSCSEKLVLDL